MYGGGGVSIIIQGALNDYDIESDKGVYTHSHTVIAQLPVGVVLLLLLLRNVDVVLRYGSAQYLNNNLLPFAAHLEVWGE